MLYCVLFHGTVSDPSSATPKDSYSQHTVQVAIQSLRFFNSFAALDLPTFQVPNSGCAAVSQPRAIIFNWSKNFQGPKKRFLMCWFISRMPTVAKLRLKSETGNSGQVFQWQAGIQPIKPSPWFASVHMSRTPEAEAGVGTGDAMPDTCL